MEPMALFTLPNYSAAELYSQPLDLLRQCVVVNTDHQYDSIQPQVLKPDFFFCPTGLELEDQRGHLSGGGMKKGFLKLVVTN